MKVFSKRYKFIITILIALSLISFSKADDQGIKIMSIGDSITDGYGTSGSYRKFLYNNLVKDGYSIDMVGPNNNWGDESFKDQTTGETISYDAAHCGYSAYAIKAYNGRNGLFETIQKGDYLKEYSPDIAILQIGTNDVIDNYELEESGDRLEILVDYILKYIPKDGALFVTTIPNLDPNRKSVYDWFSNYRHSYDWQTLISDDEAELNVQKSVDEYNLQVKALVKKKQVGGSSNIFEGDINKVITDVVSQLKDGVHPNDIGYKLMGDYWTGLIENFLKDKKRK